MVRPRRQERNRAARSFHKFKRFHHVINSDRFSVHTALVVADFTKPLGGILRSQLLPESRVVLLIELREPLILHHLADLLGRVSLLVHFFQQYAINLFGFISLPSRTLRPHPHAVASRNGILGTILFASHRPAAEAIRTLRPAIQKSKSELEEA
jgi:hypothetical protein